MWMESTRENKHSLLAWLLTPSPPPSIGIGGGSKHGRAREGKREEGLDQRSGVPALPPQYAGFFAPGRRRAGFPSRPVASRRLASMEYIYSRRNLKIDASRINCPEPERNSIYYGVHNFSLFRCGRNHRICSLQLCKFGGEGDTEANVLHTSTS